MGRKRKTRWRRLSIGETSANEEEELDGSAGAVAGVAALHLSVKCAGAGVESEENGGGGEETCDSCNKLLNGKMSNGTVTAAVDPDNPNPATMTHNHHHHHHHHHPNSSSNSSVNSGPSYQNSSASSSTSSQYGNSSHRQFHGSYNPNHHHIHPNNHSNPHYQSNHHHHHNNHQHYAGNKEPGSNNYHNGHYSNYYGARNNYNNYRNHHNHHYSGPAAAPAGSAPANGSERNGTVEEAGSTTNNEAGGNSSSNPSNGHSNYHYPSSHRGGYGGRFRKPRPYGSYYYGNNGSTGKGANGEGPNRPSYNQDEYTKITTPRQDVLFKKGYLSQKKSQSVESNSATTTPSASTNGTPDTQSTNGVHSDYSEGYENGETDSGVHYDDTVYYGAPPDAVFTDPHTGQVFYGHCSAGGEYFDAYPVMVAGYPAPVYYQMPYQAVDWNGMPTPMYPVMAPPPPIAIEDQQNYNNKGTEPMEIGANPSEGDDGGAEGKENCEGKTETMDDEAKLKESATGNNESEESSGSSGTTTATKSTAATTTTPSSGETTVTQQPTKATAQPVPGVPLPPPTNTVGIIQGPPPVGIPPPPPHGALIHGPPPPPPHHHPHHPPHLPAGAGPMVPHPPPPAFMAGPPSNHPGPNQHGLPPAPGGPPMHPPHHMNPVPGPFIYPHPGFVYGPPIYHGFMVPYGGGAVSSLEFSSSSSRKKRKKRRRKKDGQLTDEGSETASIYSNTEDNGDLVEGQEGDDSGGNDLAEFPPITDNMAEEMMEEVVQLPQQQPTLSYSSVTAINIPKEVPQPKPVPLQSKQVPPPPSKEVTNERKFTYKSIAATPRFEFKIPSQYLSSLPAQCNTEDLATPVVDQKVIIAVDKSPSLSSSDQVTKTSEEKKVEVEQDEEEDEQTQSSSSSSKRSIKKPADLDVCFQPDPTDSQLLHLQQSPIGNEPSSPDSFNTTQSVAGSEAAPGDTLSFSETDQLNRTTSVDEVEEDLPQESYYGYDSSSSTTTTTTTALPNSSSVQFASVDDETNNSPTVTNLSASVDEQQPEEENNVEPITSHESLPEEKKEEEKEEEEEREETEKMVAQEKVPEIIESEGAVAAHPVITEVTEECGEQTEDVIIADDIAQEDSTAAATDRCESGEEKTVEKTSTPRMLEDAKEINERMIKTTAITAEPSKRSSSQATKDNSTGKGGRKAKDKKSKGAAKESKKNGKTTPVDIPTELAAAEPVLSLTPTEAQVPLEKLTTEADFVVMEPPPPVWEEEAVAVEPRELSPPVEEEVVVSAAANTTSMSKSKKKNRKSPPKLIEPPIESAEGSSTLALKKAADEVELFKPPAFGDRPQSITLAVSEWLKAQGDDVLLTPLTISSSDDNDLTQEDEADDEDTDDGGGSGSRKASVQEIMRQNQKNVYGNPWVVPSNKSGTGKKGRLFLTSRRVFRVSGFKGYRALQSVKRSNNSRVELLKVAATSTTSTTASTACPDDGTNSRVAHESTPQHQVPTTASDMIIEEHEDTEDESVKSSSDKMEESQHSNYDSGLELSSPESGDIKTPPEFPPQEKVVMAAMITTAATSAMNTRCEDDNELHQFAAAASTVKPEIESISSVDNVIDNNEICNPMNFSKYYQLGIVCDDDNDDSAITTTTTTATTTGGEMDPMSSDWDEPSSLTFDATMKMTVSVTHCGNDDDDDNDENDLATSTTTTPMYYNSLKLVSFVKAATGTLEKIDDGNNDTTNNNLNGDGQSIQVIPPPTITTTIPQTCDKIESHVMNADETTKSSPYCDQVGKIVKTTPTPQQVENEKDNDDDKLELIGASTSGSDTSPAVGKPDLNIKLVTTSEHFAYIDLNNDNDEPPSLHTDQDNQNTTTTHHGEHDERQSLVSPGDRCQPTEPSDEINMAYKQHVPAQLNSQDNLYEDVDDYDDDDNEEIPVYESPDFDFLPEGHPRRSSSTKSKSVRSRLETVVATGGAGTGGQKIPCAICCVVQ